MRGGIQPYTAMVLGKAGALDDLMTHTQALYLRLPWHRNVAYVDPRVLGMRVPEAQIFTAEGACPADGLETATACQPENPAMRCTCSTL